MKIINLLIALSLVTTLSANKEKLTIKLGEFDAMLQHNKKNNRGNACKIFKYYDDNEAKLLTLETRWDIFKNYHQNYLFEMGRASAKCFNIKETNPENYMRGKRKKKGNKPSNSQRETYIRDVIIHGSDKGLLSTSIKMPGRSELINVDTDELVTDLEIKLIAKYVANGFKGTRKAKNAYLAVCRNCHRATGKGMVFVAPPISKGTLKGMMK
jgi:cytochrome c553